MRNNPLIRKAVGLEPLPQTGSPQNEPRPATRPKPVEDSSAESLKLLMHIELQAREAQTPDALNMVIANELRKLVRARQVFVFSHSAKLRIAAISGLPKVDRNVPLVREIEQTVSFLETGGNLQSRHHFSIPHDAGDPASALGSYPFRNLLWFPFKHKTGAKLGGMLLARETPWGGEELAILERITGSFAHAMTLLRVEKSLAPKFDFRKVLQRKYLFGVIAACLLILAYPVSMTVLAPFEVSARSPFVVSAYLDGAIEEIFVEPGESVAEGQPLLRFVDTVQQNLLAIAEKEVMVGEARLKRTSQLAFESRDGRHELGTAISELALKNAELKLARDQSLQTVVKATKPGVAVFSDKQSLLGKPVVAGERIMEIADPQNVEIAVDLAVRDSIMLEPGARVKLFLDSDPLHAREAIVEYIDYKAGSTPAGTLAYRITAALQDKGTHLPRLGVQGTAQLYGNTVPLGMYLFRRPLTAVRQWLGL